MDDFIFKPRESKDEPITPRNTVSQTKIAVPAKTTENWLRRQLHRSFHVLKTDRKGAAIGIAVAVVLIGLGYFGIQFLAKKFTHSTADAKVSTVKNVAKPRMEASKLSGVSITPELNKRPVTAIMIENSPDARPQAGLIDAGVVFEAIAEGGISRFTTLFLEGQPSYIGPVRSLRPYYLDWILPFDPAVVHAGGSAQALADVRNLGVKDLDHGANGQAFRRVSNRAAPHNLYTSMADLDKLQQAKNYSSSFTGFQRKPDAKPLPTVTARSIDFNISTSLYNPHFDFDEATNSYKRSQDGKPHVDEKSSKQLNPKVVVALVMNYSQSGIYSVYQTTGSGKAYVFQDGIVTEGKWSKAGRKDQIMFTTDDGKALRLNAGQTWVTAVVSNDRVSYKP